MPTSSAKLTTLMAFFLPSRHSLAISNRLQNISVHTVFNCLRVDTKKNLYRKNLLQLIHYNDIMPRIRRSTQAASRQTASTPSNAQLDQLTTEVLRLRCDKLKLTATRSRQTLLARLRAAPRPAENTIPPDPEPTVIPNDTTSTTTAVQEPLRAVRDRPSSSRPCKL